MSGNLEEEKSDEENVIDTRQMSVYNASTACFYTIFSALSPKKFVKRLIAAIDDKEIEVKIDEKMWMLNFEIHQ